MPGWKNIARRHICVTCITFPPSLLSLSFQMNTWQQSDSFYCILNMICQTLPLFRPLLCWPPQYRHSVLVCHSVFIVSFPKGFFWVLAITTLMSSFGKYVASVVHRAQLGFSHFGSSANIHAFVVGEMWDLPHNSISDNFFHRGAVVQELINFEDSWHMRQFFRLLFAVYC